MTGDRHFIDKGNRSAGIASALGAWAGGVSLAPGWPLKLSLAGIPLLAGFVSWSILRPHRWLLLFFLSLLLLPPLPLGFGTAGVSLAPMAVVLGIVTSIVWARRWNSWNDPMVFALAIFIGMLLESVAFAALYSGWEIAMGSLARVGLFAISGFVFLYAHAGPRDPAWNSARFVKILFAIAIVESLFSCADFYFQFPAPAGFGDQFVYLESGVFRRAQGFFYEASTLGNFCAFFLVMALVSLTRPRGEAFVSRTGLRTGLVALGAALMLSYSRASVINVAVALAVFGALHFKKVRRPLTISVAALALVAIAVHLAAPALSANYWGRLLGSFTFFGQSPDEVLSGRLDHWRQLTEFLSFAPWHAIFGVGYKTLPYSTFTGSTVIADNTYLGLLVETGVIGLAAFFWLNFQILRTGWRAARSAKANARFFGEWIFCFWCGELVQMFSGDLITYWRVLPVYFWVLGIAARHAREDA